MVKETPHLVKPKPVYGNDKVMDEQRLRMTIDILSRDTKNLGKSLRQYRGRTSMRA